ncbi:hypothetical protein Tco_0959619 [Tanacetum coccineum]
MLVWGEADSKTSPKRSLRRKLFKTCCMNWGEVNLVHAYYNGSCSSKDNEDQSWSTSFKTRRTQKTSSALEVLWKTLFVLYLYLIRTFPPPPKTSPLEDDDLVEEEAIKVIEKKPLENDVEMLKKFGLEDSKPMKMPMSPDTKLMKDKEGESVDNTKYRGMIGSLLYLAASRPDIMFSVCLCARFQEDPKTSHLEAVKHIF